MIVLRERRNVMPKSRCMMLLAVFTAFAWSALADEIEFQGSAAGTFTPSTSTLTFTGSAFDQTSPSGTTILALGTFNLTISTANVNYNHDTFDLQVAFSLPQSIGGGQSPDFTADLLGDVNQHNKDHLTITFAVPTRSFSFSNSQGNGSFDFALCAVFGSCTADPSQTVIDLN